ncbi:MAG: transcriptional regulator [Gammaproteobacteria bacterium HGW-Gammaproteobacteria-4]|jgi:Zn-dependent peptidase ImmA (M78 family)/DNA-binding XRE family transcriptional regulator|nr:MAG: transcriptional regulator [Gammaproteobacteria bacterium HGW-Gammaproteobacteria-4]
MLGSRIKQGRVAAGLSLRELAQAVGLSAMAISKYERDQIKPSSETLLRLAKALDVRTEYFFRQPGVELSEVEFRKHSRLSAKDEGRALEDVREQMERWLELEAIIPASWPKAFAPPRGLPIQVKSYEDIELQAEKVRAAWQLGVGPIRNLIDKMEEEGINVFLTSHDGGKKFDGLAAKANGHTVIVVGQDWPGDRQRFTLAHELGHLVLHGRLAPGLDEERACNRFAGAFLVPKDEVHRLLGSSRSWLEPRELYLLKHEWGLSMNGWLYRAQDLGILNKSAARRHWEFFAQQGEAGTSWRECEPGDSYPRECPRRFAQLVYRALAEDLIGESRAAELFGVPLVELRLRRRMEATDAADCH